MTKTATDRITNTINFMVGLRTVDGANNEIRIQRVGELLQSRQHQIPVNVGVHMSIGNSGTEQERRFRRAIILVSCFFLNSQPAATQKVTKKLAADGLRGRLRSLADLIFTTFPINVITPVKDQMMANPATFLAANPVVLAGAGQSRQEDISMVFDIHADLYKLDTAQDPGLLHLDIPGFFVGVDNYQTAYASLGAIPLTTVTRNFFITTQLTGCAFLYRVTGPTLKAAHIQQHDDALQHINQQMRANIEVPTAVNKKSLAMSQLFQERAVLEGNGGHMGMLATVTTGGQEAWRRIDRGEGQDWMNFHGYYQRNGMCYVIGFKSGGGWKIFAQQHNRSANGLVLRRLYPLPN